jgi:hypothetical protein
MTRREAKRRACAWVANALNSDINHECIAYQDVSEDGVLRTDQDRERMEIAFTELFWEMDRRSQKTWVDLDR